MKITKPKIIAGSVVIMGIAAMGATALHAASNTTATDPVSNLVTALAQKFNVSTSDVQAVFDEHHTQMKAQHRENQKDRLDKAVTDGILTQKQKDLIITKLAEEQVFRDSLKNKTRTERAAAMKEHVSALKKWAADNNIPEEYGLFGGGPRSHHGKGGPGMGRGMMHEDIDSATN